MNMAYKFPSVFWNTACLIVESKGTDEIGDWTSDYETGIYENGSDFEDEEDDDEEEEDEEEKRKNKTVNYGKISSAIGKMKEYGITVGLPDINKSDFTFTPDIMGDKIIFGIKGITKINSKIAKEIIEKRPYTSFNDFREKVKLSILPLINLIKSGCFDEIEEKSRKELLWEILKERSKPKEKLTLANVPMLYKYNLIPEDCIKERKVFFYHKALLKLKKEDIIWFTADTLAFFEENFGSDNIQFSNGKAFIEEKEWKKLYNPQVARLKKRLKEDDDIIEKLNQKLFEEQIEKYGKGNLFKWEMDSVSFYHSGHELDKINNEKYEISNFFEMPETAVVERTLNIKGKKIPLLELNRIAGTVLEKNKPKNLLIISTVYGVVEVKIWKAQFAKYDKQLFKKLPNGKKKVIEKSWFSRGNKLLITGVRRGDVFIPKIYKSSKYSRPIELILDVEEDGTLITKGERAE